MVLGKSPPQCSAAPSSRCAPLPPLAQERPGDMHGMPTDACQLLPPPEHRHLQSGSEVPPGRGHGHSPPAQLDKENLVSKVTSRVMARTVSSMLTVVLVAVGLEPGDGKLETLRLKPGRAVVRPPPGLPCILILLVA